MEKHLVLGVDVGASGIKGAIIDIRNGDLLTERLRVKTPQPATPANMAIAFKELVDMHQWQDGLIGVGFPAVVIDGIAKTASNIDKSWIGTNVEQVFSEVTNCPVIAVNDADAAGIAEMSYGIGKGELGTVVLITIGSGLGSALFTDGKLVRNSEFGHFELNGKKAELYASDRTRRTLDLDWEEWGKRFNTYLIQLNRLLFPSLLILGGGTSKKFEKFSKEITADIPIKIAEFRNRAGAIGAAMYAHEQYYQTVMADSTSSNVAQ